MTMLLEHQPGVFDPGQCRDCARESDLLDHCWQVERQEQAFRETRQWARRAQRRASCALWSFGVGVLLAIVALLTG
jgi:hypothetical protein